MKTKVLFATLVLSAAFATGASTVGELSSSELANETADLPLYTGNMAVYTALVTVGLALGMLALMDVGRRIGTRHLKSDPAEARKGLAAVEGAIFSLLGLLVAFSFYGAAARFDARRELVIQEADRIRAAWLQLDLLAQEDRSALQELFRHYLDSRLNTYRKLPDAAAVKTELARSMKLEDEIWERAIAACHRPVISAATALLMPALNQMFGIAHTRVASARIHPPKLIFTMLSALTLISALLIGYGMAGRKSRSWIHVIGFVIAMAATIHLIYDLEYPRLGLIRIDAMDQLLVDLRHRMD